MKGARSRLWLLWGLSLGCADATNPGVESPAGTLLPAEVRLTPVVAANGEPFVLELRLADPAGPVIHAVPLEPLGLTRGGEALGSLILRDDGVPPDREAGDGWYAAGDLVLEPGEGGVASPYLGPLRSIHEPGGGGAPDTTIYVTVPFRAVDTTVVWLPDDREFIALAVPPSIGTIWSGQAIHIRNHIDGLGFPTAEFRDFGSASHLSWTGGSQWVGVPAAAAAAGRPTRRDLGAAREQSPDGGNAVFRRCSEPFSIAGQRPRVHAPPGAPAHAA